MGVLRHILSAILLMAAIMSVIGRSAPPAQAAVSPQGETFRGGYPRIAFTDVDAKDAQAALEIWLKQVVQTADFPLSAKVNIYFDESAIVNAFKNKQLDFVILSSPIYLKIKDLVPIEPTFVPAYFNHVGDEYLLLVHRDTKVTALKQLKNRKIMIHEKVSSESPQILWINCVLHDEGLPTWDRFFSHPKLTDKPSQAILPVLFKQADACLVKRRSFETAAELNPQIGKELVTLVTSPPLLRGVIAFRKDVSDRLKKFAIKKLEEMHTNTQGRQILTLLKYDKLVSFKSNYLNSIASLFYRTCKK